MDKKKLIGTIIGVACFAALIAGATFAWLTLTATVTNGNYAGGSLNFTYTYGTGTNVNAIKMLTATPTTASITANNGYVALSAEKPAGTAKASNFIIKLAKTTNTIEDSTVLRYAVCRGTAAECGNANGGSIPASASGKWVAVNAITYDTTTQTLYTDTTSFQNEGHVGPIYYFVYLWIDGSKITSSNQDKVMGKQFSGYIYAESTQTD